MQQDVILPVSMTATSDFLIQILSVLLSFEYNLSPPANLTAPEVKSLPSTNSKVQNILCVLFAVRSFGIVGGGTVLFGASAIVATQTLLPIIGEM